MPAYKVEICGVNTAKLPILKETEKEALFARIQAGRSGSQRDVYQRQPAPCVKCDQAVLRQP